jgi:AraC-like DNA-binding protein
MASEEKSSGNASWPGQLLQKHPVRQVYVCGRQTEPPVLGHVVNFPRLEVPLSGCYENQIEVDGRPVMVQLKPGTALFAPSNCWNLPTWKHRVQLVSLLFGKKQLGISIVTAQSGRSPGATARKFSQPMPVTGPIAWILDALEELQIAGQPTAAFPEMVRALLHCVRHAVLQPAPTLASPAKLLVEDMCVFIQNNYQYDITRDSVAHQFGVSPNYLSRVFQLQGHMTFSDYLMHVRTDRAKYLLHNYNLKLDDIAARCGYRDTGYFCRVFKKVARTTPSAFRAQHKSAATGVESEKCAC